MTVKREYNNRVWRKHKPVQLLAPAGHARGGSRALDRSGRAGTRPRELLATGAGTQLQPGRADQAQAVALSVESAQTALLAHGESLFRTCDPWKQLLEKYWLRLPVGGDSWPEPPGGAVRRGAGRQWPARAAHGVDRRRGRTGAARPRGEGADLRRRRGHSARASGGVCPLALGLAAGALLGLRRVVRARPGRAAQLAVVGAPSEVGTSERLQIRILDSAAAPSPRFAHFPSVLSRAIIDCGGLA
jgi:hypothetical protein